jgi:hypothetical protein
MESAATTAIRVRIVEALNRRVGAVRLAFVAPELPAGAWPNCALSRRSHGAEPFLQRWCIAAAVSLNMPNIWSAALPLTMSKLGSPGPKKRGRSDSDDAFCGS